jgi:NitT/TauT family transport system substrate-binding protein
MRRLVVPFALVVLLVPACASSDARARGSADVLRLGVFPTLTHAPAHIGMGSGIFAATLAPTRVEVHPFNSGTEAGIALLSGSIDASYMGPWPTASLFLRSGKVAVVSGVTVGGASLVVRRGAEIAVPDDLHGKRIAVPSVGNSQDLALRTWLHEQGLTATDEGGDISITDADSPQLLQLFRSERIDGAWVPEPYPTYLVEQGVADLFFDEADLWPPGEFLSANLVVSTIYMDAHPNVVQRLVQANVDAIRFAHAQPLRAQAISERRLVWAGAPPMDAAVIADAWAKLTFTWEPVPASMVKVADDARALGILEEPPTGILGVYRLDPLNRVLDDEGLPPVEVPA